MFAKGELHLSFYLCELLEMSVWSLPVPAIVFQPELAFATQRRRNTQGYSVSLHETLPNKSDDRPQGSISDATNERSCVPVRITPNRRALLVLSTGLRSCTLRREQSFFLCASIV